MEIPTTAAIVGLRPGDVLDHVPVPASGRLGRKRSRRRPTGPGSASTVATAITRLAAGSGELIVHAPAPASSRGWSPAGIDIRAEGLAIEAQIGWGRPAVGRDRHRGARRPTPRRRRRASTSAARRRRSSWSGRASTSRPCRVRGPSASAAVIVGRRRRPRHAPAELVRGPAAGRLHAAAPFATPGHGLATAAAHPAPRLGPARRGRGPAGRHPAESARTLIIGGDPDRCSPRRRDRRARSGSSAARGVTGRAASSACPARGAGRAAATRPAASSRWPAPRARPRAHLRAALDAGAPRRRRTAVTRCRVQDLRPDRDVAGRQPSPADADADDWRAALAAVARAGGPDRARRSARRRARRSSPRASRAGLGVARRRQQPELHADGRVRGPAAALPPGPLSARGHERGPRGRPARRAPGRRRDAQRVGRPARRRRSTPTG